VPNVAKYAFLHWKQEQFGRALIRKRLNFGIFTTLFPLLHHKAFCLYIRRPKLMPWSEIRNYIISMLKIPLFKIHRIPFLYKGISGNFGWIVKIKIIK
jgi:hypothetical protein